MNETIILLIPKIPSPTNMANFKPINLCNVIYKLIAKVIANHFRKLLEACIDSTQNAFVLSKLISNNILVAFVMLHTFEKKGGRKGHMVLKLDMSKAYDRVKWSFIRAIMIKIGFDYRWVKLIMRCVTTISYKITFNGYFSSSVSPRRCLRQGDPLSPFLFLICNEGLFSLLRLNMKNDLLKGVKASKNDPSISHLLFTSDCIIFGQSTLHGARLVKKILKKYDLLSSQCVNFEKYVVFFNKNTLATDSDLITRELGVKRTSNPK